MYHRRNSTRTVPQKSISPLSSAPGRKGQRRGLAQRWSRAWPGGTWPGQWIGVLLPTWFGERAHRSGASRHRSLVLDLFASDRGLTLFAASRLDLSLIGLGPTGVRFVGAVGTGLPFFGAAGTGLPFLGAAGTGLPFLGAPRSRLALWGMTATTTGPSSPCRSGRAWSASWRSSRVPGTATETDVRPGPTSRSARSSDGHAL